MENVKSVIANNIETFYKLDLEYNIVMHKLMLMQHQRDIKILTNAEGKRKLEEAFKKEYEEESYIVYEKLQELPDIKIVNVKTPFQGNKTGTVKSGLSIEKRKQLKKKRKKK